MDRFIAHMHRNHFQNHKTLKSNMDRFIAHMHRNHFQNHKTLKSNMDRFIAEKVFSPPMFRAFKIQYG